MSEDEMKPNLLTVIPGNITIENFVPGRVYKETLMIYNTCNVPIVINLKSSDKSKLSISDSKLRIGVNQAKKLDLLIQDKMNYKYIKTPIKQKKLFIHMKGDLIDVKYEINLLYYNKNKNNISQRINYNQNFINNNQLNLMNNEIPNQMMMNNLYSDFPQEYLAENPDNLINNQNINNLNFQNYNNENPHYNNQEKINFNINQNNNNKNINEKIKTPFISFRQNDNEEVISLKNIINELAEKVTYLQSLLEQKQFNLKNNNKKILNISRNSFFIFGTNIEKDIKNKYKLDDNIEIQSIISKNKILELENSTLLYRIKSLEKKLSLFESNNYNINLKNNENYNNMINADENFEEPEDNNNLDLDRYKYIYKDENKKIYFMDNDINIPFFEDNINPNFLNRNNDEMENNINPNNYKLINKNNSKI